MPNFGAKGSKLYCFIYVNLRVIGKEGNLLSFESQTQYNGSKFECSDMRILHIVKTLYEDVAHIAFI